MSWITDPAGGLPMLLAVGSIHVTWVVGQAAPESVIPALAGMTTEK